MSLCAVPRWDICLYVKCLDGASVSMCGAWMEHLSLCVVPG